MRDLGVRMVSVNTIKYDMPDVRRRMTLPAVIELAESRKRMRIHPLMVSSPDMSLIAGRDRLAADLLNGTKRVEVRIVDATPEERQALEIDENLHRRPVDRDALIARRVKLVQEGAATMQNDSEPTPQLPDNLSGKRKRGRPATVGPAREAVARELGTTPEAVRKAEARAAAAAEPRGEDFGPTDLGEVQNCVDLADKDLRAAQAALSRLEGLRFDPALRAARPEAVCSACNANNSFCDACGSVGLQTAAQIASAKEAAKQVGLFAKVTAPSVGDEGAGAPVLSGVRTPADVPGSAKPAPAPGEPIVFSPKQLKKPKVKIVDENDKPISIDSPPVNDDDLPF